MIEERKQILVVTLTELAISEYFDDFEQENLERCPECGSSLFRLYKQHVPEGSYDQFICAVCNHRWGGYLNDYNIQFKEKGNNCCKVKDD